MLRIKVTCDYCGDEIIGEYRKVRQEFTNRDTTGVRNCISDMCMNCLKVIKDYKRLPVLSSEDFKDAAIQ